MSDSNYDDNDDNDDYSNFFDYLSSELLEMVQ